MTNAVTNAETASTNPPIVMLPKEHPVPWSSQSSQEEMGHMICDANGVVVVRCVKTSKDEEEKLARAIAAVPNMVMDITHLRARNVELEVTIAKLNAEISLLKIASCRDRPDRNNGGQIMVATRLPLSRGDHAAAFCDAVVESAALIEAHISIPGLIRTLVGPWSRLLTITTRAAGRRINALRQGS
jgi:hypothetical protein